MKMGAPKSFDKLSQRSFERVNGVTRRLAVMSPTEHQAVADFMAENYKVHGRDPYRRTAKRRARSTPRSRPRGKRKSAEPFEDGLQKLTKALTKVKRGLR